MENHQFFMGKSTIDGHFQGRKLSTLSRGEVSDWQLKDEDLETES
jgi:hypothetical protein